MRDWFKKTIALWTLGSVLTGVLGCGTAPAGALSLYPDSHRLLEATKQIRDTAPVPAPVPRELQKSVVPVYTVEPGDVLLVEPIALDSPLRFPADQTVLVDGTIDLGQFGRLHVAGLSVEQIEDQVETAIRSA
ncbi:MAG: polysaccharide biosynthesis/export family protein, partial [Planctomycetaceae bacterium]|nr:polysaccharide biosynthesis/export family protein [Planctomycetaceae bacterium]